MLISPILPIQMDLPSIAFPSFSFSHMASPWAVIISLFVVACALVIKHFLAEIIEEEHIFMQIIGVFILVYIGAAVAIGALNSPLS